MAFKKYSTFEQAKQDGVEYMLTIGRRQPMHVAHWTTIKKIRDNGFVPVIVIGSTNTATRPNGAEDPKFDPIANPLSAAEQREQIRRAFPDWVEGKDYLVFEMRDMGNNPKWCQTVVDTLKGHLNINGKYPDISGKTACHFIGKDADKRPRKLVRPDGSEEEVMSHFWEGTFDEMGLPVLEDVPHEGIDISLSATQLRSADLFEKQDQKRDVFAAYTYITNLAYDARVENLEVKDEEFEKLPVTMLDISLKRLAAEKGIMLVDVLNEARRKTGQVTIETLTEAARSLNKSPILRKEVDLKIALASLNQTVYDFANNVANIKAAIDKAVEDGADILGLQELGLTGYAADDYHQWNKDNETVWRQIKHVAEYAAAKNPNLIISLGTPWHFKDTEAHASDPLYNINNRPYNTQFTITGGKVVAIAAKSVLADGPAEYEPRQFRNWPEDKGTISITLPDGSVVPFGKPVMSFGKEGDVFNLFTEQCAEGWAGVNDDLTINSREQQQARYLSRLVQHTDITVALNPSASRPQPAINKSKIRQDGLCASAPSNVYGYVNVKGSESGLHGDEGDQIFAQDGKVIHVGERYNFTNMSYSSKVVTVPVATRGVPHVVVAHEFSNTHEKGAAVGGPAEFESAQGDELVYEEYMRSTALWLRDYLAKQPWNAQGYLISLSGGADSAYGAIAAATMLDLDIKQEGVEGFFKRFPNIKCKDEALKIFREKGEAEAVKFIKYNMLTFVYLPSDNSSQTTLKAARILIEGGILEEDMTLPNGTVIKAGTKLEGIGGRFSVHPIQPAVDEYIISHAGLNIEQAIKDMRNDPSIPAEDLNIISRLQAIDPKIYETWARSHIKDLIKKYVDSELYSNPQLPDFITKNCTRAIPTWANPADDVVLQNFQARARGVISWAIANQEGKIALVTSNASESAIGYTTAGGDMSMGGANPIGGIPKSTLKKSLFYLCEKGLKGLKAVTSVIHVVVQKATAELRKLQEGQAAQTDENDLGFTYEECEVMEKLIITERQTPLQALKTIREQYHNTFPADIAEIREKIIRFADWRWPGGQFKRIMGTTAPYVGLNNDSEQSVRTTVLGDHFKTALAAMTLVMAKGKLGGDKEFEQVVGITLDEAKGVVERSASLKKQLLKLDCPLIKLSAEELATSQLIKEIKREHQRELVELKR